MCLLLCEQHGAVALVTLHRPEALNALNAAMIGALSDRFAAIAADESIRAVVLTGEGKAFVAGADIAEMQSLSPDEARVMAARGVAVFLAIENLPQPVIAAVNGYALGGGCELALACDIRIASEKAKFAQPEVSLGITPGFGGTQRLPRAIGYGAAMEWILTGKTVDAAEALHVRLVNAVYPPDALMDAAMKLADTIAANAPVAVRAAKHAMRAGADTALPVGMIGESDLFATCFATEDQKNAMTAFVEKRKPKPFRGK